MVVNMTTAVSLFAGVGGFDLALERAGVKVVASVEWDKHCHHLAFANFSIFNVKKVFVGISLIKI